MTEIDANDQPQVPAPHMAPAQTLGQQLMQLVADPNISAEKLQMLLGAQREMMIEQRRERYQTAFVALSGRLPQVHKDGYVELGDKGGRSRGYRYAKYEDMMKAIGPLLLEHGFAFSFAPLRMNGKDVAVRGRLMHIDGHYEEAEFSLPPDIGPGRNSLQAVGSSLSYCKRYIAEQLLNIVRQGEDDDGISAVRKPISEEQRRLLEVLLDEVRITPEYFLSLFVTGCQQMRDIPASDFPRLKNALEEKKASKSKGKKAPTERSAK